MSKFIYICGINDKSIYYNEESEEFYSVDEGFFPFEDAKDFEVSENFFTHEQLESLASSRVTDEHELKSYQSMYNMIKAYEKKHSSKLYKIGDAIKEELSVPEIRHDIFKYFATSCIFSLFIILVYFKSAPLREEASQKIEEKVDKYREEHQNDEAHLESFYAAIEANSTISDELKTALKNDFEALVASNVYIPDAYSFKRYTTKGICSRLKSADFTNYDETNYTDLLANILFSKNDIVASSLALNLDEYANNRVPSTSSILFGSLYTKDKISLLNDIFNYGTDKYIEDMALELGTDEKSIKEILKLVEDYKNAENYEQRLSSETELYNHLAIILGGYYRNNTNIKDIDKFILASQVYNGKFVYSNNLFDDTLTITYDDPNYGTYNLYYDIQTGADISQAVYLKKLVELIESKGNSLDYDDPDSRFLIYLTTLAYEDKMHYHADELINSTTPEYLANKIYEAVFSEDEGFTNLKPQVIYAYFSSGVINLNDIIREITSPNDDAFSIALFVEYNRCLRRDIEAGNLSEEEYQRRLEYALEWVLKDGEEVYDILVNSLQNDTSLFSELHLSPFTFEYANEDIKKYIYIPEE